MTEKKQPKRASLYPFSPEQNEALLRLIDQLRGSRSGVIREAVARLCEENGIGWPGRRL